MEKCRSAFAVLCARGVVDGMAQHGLRPDARLDFKVSDAEGAQPTDPPSISTSRPSTPPPQRRSRGDCGTRPTRLPRPPQRPWRRHPRLGTLHRATTRHPTPHRMDAPMTEPVIPRGSVPVARLITPTLRANTFAQSARDRRCVAGLNVEIVEAPL